MIGSEGEPDGGRRRRRKYQGRFGVGMSKSYWLAAYDDGGLVSSRLNCKQILDMCAVIYLP